MGNLGIRHRIPVPSWLANRPGFNSAYKVLYTLAANLDILIEAAEEGIMAAWPGSTSRTDSLPYIGRTRGIIRGEVESDSAYEARLTKWIDTHWNCGASGQLALAIQKYLGNTPKVSIIDRVGNWAIAETNGSVRYIGPGRWYTVNPGTVLPGGLPLGNGVVTPTGFSIPGTITPDLVNSGQRAINWDYSSNPERANNWANIWIVIYPCEWPVAGTIAATEAPGPSVSGGFDDTGIGHTVATNTGDTVKSLVNQWIGEHVQIQSIVWCYDSTLFDPTNLLIAGNPNGQWGNWRGRQGSTCRFWQPRGD